MDLCHAEAILSLEIKKAFFFFGTVSLAVRTRLAVQKHKAFSVSWDKMAAA